MSLRCRSLFSPLQVGPMHIKNRFMRSATCEQMSERDGRPSRQLFDVMSDLIDGDVGLIIPGSMYTLETGKISHKQSGLTSKEMAEDWRPVISYAHQNDAKVMFQLSHGGFLSLSQRVEVKKIKKDKQKKKYFMNSNDQNTSQKVFIQNDNSNNVNDIGKVGELNEITTRNIFRGYNKIFSYIKNLKQSEIEDIISSFANAAKLAESVGADGVQIHASHGYLLSEFLAPISNFRTDEFGRTLGNKTKIIREIVDAIRQSTKPSFSVSIKIGTMFGISQKKLSQIISKHLNNGIDFYEISTGYLNPLSTIRVQPTKFNVRGIAQRIINPWPFYEEYCVDAAKYVKKKSPEKIIASVGGWRDSKSMEKAISRGKIDLISMSRPFIREPNLVRKIKDGKSRHAKCKNCGKCMLDHGNNRLGVHCYFP
ncbi:oxidoreductase, FAD/FMN-binding family protein [Tritrichomonas foetus]|uniref:Oxidoreductase, FAD/FMN-binding family protein n=1 Tax=Tritrichomonas foetus TaxID=1144522 RepID=A0A1J4JGK8_9EUKA|nr:oxidoreductase, FAD/FMN-binding family protein [Tritrichomonas foetus]|eukprot:OHS96340.1 oxidoreductase, FAD/FMN-binding family protein [Tritrichomonas foetus]